MQVESLSVMMEPGPNTRRVLREAAADAFPCAKALLDMWERPWSPNAKRFALHALARAYRAGCDVMELAKQGFA